jgi:hypothetical protein
MENAIRAMHFLRKCIDKTLPKPVRGFVVVKNVIFLKGQQQNDPAEISAVAVILRYVNLRPA